MAPFRWPKVEHGKLKQTNIADKRQTTSRRSAFAVVAVLNLTNLVQLTTRNDGGKKASGVNVQCVGANHSLQTPTLETAQDRLVLRGISLCG